MLMVFCDLSHNSIRDRLYPSTNCNNLKIFFHRNTNMKIYYCQFCIYFRVEIAYDKIL